MRAASALLLVAVLFAGCLQIAPDTLPGATSVTAGTPYPYDAEFDTTGSWSRTLVPGPYSILPAQEVFLRSFDGTPIHMGIFLPDVPAGTSVPVIVDAGPYYLDGDAAATSAQTRRLGGFLIEQFVPHGYAVAQVSIRGTGLSGGCVDYMGEKEQRDLDAAITFLGEAEWSNGAIGMIGRSYDGSTPWEVATFGNPYLKTIVPISGITDLQQLHYRNGTSEVRSVALGALYYSYAATQGGTGGPEEDPRLVARMACAEGPQHAPMGVYGYATGGGHVVPGPTDRYWAVRDFTGRVLENYEGSIFYIHGLQDWNVKPSQGVDVYNAFEGKKKALLGQWGHNYPDRPDEHEHLRWDWAEMLLRWFDSELKGIPTDTGPALEIEDDRGRWRVEPHNAWPPTDATWLKLHPTADGALVAEGAEGRAQVWNPYLRFTPAGRAVGPYALAFESEPFAADTRISGMPQFHVTVRSPTPGGTIHAELVELDSDGDARRIGWASMDLRYAAGGKTPSPYTPNTDVVAKMELYPLDTKVLAGNRIALVVTLEALQDGELPNPATSQMTITFGDDATTLALPVIQRPDTPSRWDVEGAAILDENA
ncbi:MAG TPA: CocE/NonD family hydrolase [Candidatus Thermoplasmatota archaeon]|nr:CocE/NonD family hydrolase [Candidatus Thermoplasmatota archaeon]